MPAEVPDVCGAVAALRELATDARPVGVAVKWKLSNGAHHWHRTARQDPMWAAEGRAH